MIGARHAVVHERAGDELAVLVIDRALVQRLADTVGDAAVNLALDDHRIDNNAEVIHGGPGDDLGVAGLRINFDFADVAAGGEGEIGRVPERALLQPGLELLAVEFVRDVSVERHASPRHRLVGAGDAELAVLELDVGFGGFEQMRRYFLGLGLHLIERLHERRHADRARA